ncbi:MAG: hypothetical protein IKM30_08110 [Oscillospiraceae bacterium]|nr:hypothetical protein [Oscillospiraceae bacterium]
MVCITLFGLRIGIDFTAPAFAALLLLLLPRSELLLLLSACLIHETAHFLTLAWIGCRPAFLRISAVGWRLSAERAALYPMQKQAVILLSGTAANLLTALFCCFAGMPQAMTFHLSLGLFNLLPYRAADGGTLLYALLEDLLMPMHRSWLKPLWYSGILVFTTAMAAVMIRLPQQSLSLWLMLLFLVLSECFCHSE